MIREAAGGMESWVEKAFERHRPWTRDLVAFGVALLGYVFLMSPALYESATALRSGALGRALFPRHVVELVGRSLGTAGRARAAEQLREAVARGELSHGAALLRLNQLSAAARGGPEFDREGAERLYRNVLNDARRRLETGDGVVRAIERASDAHGYKSYKRIHDWLGDALLNGGGSCQAQTALVSALALDLGLGERAFIRVFKNHVAPDLVDELGHEHHFGMLADCHGPGERITAERLLELYDPAGDRPFAWPAAQGDCDDPLTDFAEPALRVRDETVGSTALSESERGREMMILDTPCGSPDPPWSAARRVAILTPSGFSFSARYFTLAPWHLGYQSERVNCQSRLIEERRHAGAPAVELAIELGKLVSMSEDASVAFTAAGHADLSREFQHRRTAAWRAAQTEILRAKVREFEPEGGSSDQVISEAWALMLLGVEGRRLLLELAERFTPPLTALVWDVETRPRALELLERRHRVDQFRVLESLADPALERELLRASTGQSLKKFSLLRAAARGYSARECSFEKMLADVDARLEQYGLDKDFRVVLLLLQMETWPSGCSSGQFLQVNVAFTRWLTEHEPAAAHALGLSWVSPARSNKDASRAGK